MLESEKEYECQNPRCRCRFKVKADIEQGGIMEVPVEFGSSVHLDKMSVQSKLRKMQICHFQANRSSVFFADVMQREALSAVITRRFWSKSESKCSKWVRCLARSLLFYSTI